MPTSVELALVDTNILVARVFPEHEHHAGARRLFERLLAGEVKLCAPPQVFAKFFAVVTDARRVTSARTPEEALVAIEAFLALPGLTVAVTPIDLVQRLIALVRRRPTTRGRVFDYQIAALMAGNGVSRIYTFNTADFASFDGIEAVEP